MTASPKGRGDTPTSIIQSSRRSPQLYGKTAVTLNNFTTKIQKPVAFHIYTIFLLMGGSPIEERRVAAPR